MLPLLSLCLAAEPGVSFPPLPTGRPGVPVELVLSWTDVRFRPAGPESAAYGPDMLAIGPDGAWAVVDAGGRRLLGSFGVLLIGAVDGVAFAADGDLLVQSHGVVLRYADGVEVGKVSVPPLVPGGARLLSEGEDVYARDVFGNDHPVARAPTVGGLEPALARGFAPGPVVRRSERGVVTRDGEVVVSGALAARPVGACTLVEYGVRGAVSARELRCDDGAYDLPVDGLYRPYAGVAASGADVAWLDPRADGLHLVRVSR